MTIENNPEFGYEMAITMPYAYYLKQQGEEVKVITCTGMKPFYWFADEVEEKYDKRSIDNRINGVNKLPNNWIHHNAIAMYGKDYSELTPDQQYEVNGVLDYSEWLSPPLKEQYYDETIELPDNFVVISNKYNLEHGKDPVSYYTVEALNTMLTHFKQAGYNVIYKRPQNIEFPNDENELKNTNLVGYVEGLGRTSDYDLIEAFDNAYLMDDIIDGLGLDYNEGQLKIFSRSEGFIGLGGGSSILLAYFGKPLVVYVNVSKDVRPGYFEGDCYFRKLSGADVYPAVDLRADIEKRGYQDYSTVFENMTTIWK